jgi:signal transduction histidine kinase
VGANVIVGLVILGGCSYWAFIATIARGSQPPLLRGLIVAELAIALVLSSWPGAFTVLVIAATIILLVPGSVTAWLLVSSVRARTPGAVPIAVACALAIASVLAMIFFRMPFLAGLPLIHYGLVSAIALAVLALVLHVHEMNHQVQRVTKYALEAHTRERSRLARDLHDGLGQMLALLKLQMQRMGRKHEGEPVQRTFDDSAEQVAATLDELRRIARDLRPAPMQDRGLGDAVREYASAMALRTDLEVEVEGDYRDPVSESIGDELYRITQECLTNCLKHSGARRVVVTLAEVGDRYSLIVADDGRGLPAEQSRGLGMATIHERSELLGGSCTITSNEGGGTRVEVRVPR